MLHMAAADATFLDLNTLVTGGSGAAIMAAIIFVGKLILDRTIPSRSDTRASLTLVLESLKNMVAVLQDEKRSDAQRLSEKQERIDVLEESSTADYNRIIELRTEIIDLRSRLAQKDRHIRMLIAELQKLGISDWPSEESEEDFFDEGSAPTGETKAISGR